MMKVINVTIILIGLCVIVLSEGNSSPDGDAKDKETEAIKAKIEELKQNSDSRIREVTVGSEALLTAVKSTSLSNDETKALYSMFYSGKDRERVVVCTRQKNKVDKMRMHAADSVNRCVRRVKSTLEEVNKSTDRMTKEAKQCLINHRILPAADPKCQDKLKRTVDSFSVFDSLKDFETRMGLKFCQQVTDAYKEAIDQEERDLRTCIAGGGKPISVQLSGSSENSEPQQPNNESTSK